MVILSCGDNEEDGENSNPDNQPSILNAKIIVNVRQVQLCQSRRMASSQCIPLDITAHLA